MKYTILNYGKSVVGSTDLPEESELKEKKNSHTFTGNAGNEDPLPKGTIFTPTQKGTLKKSHKSK